MISQEEKDTLNKLHYSTFFVFISQLLLTLATAIPTFLYFLPTVSIIFDVSVIIFAYFLLGLKRFYRELTNVYLIVIFAAIASIFDIIMTILWFIFYEKWITYPFLMLRLAHIIVTLVCLGLAFLLVVDIAKYLVRKKSTERKIRYFLPIGYFMLLAPYLYVWYGDYASNILLRNIKAPLWENLFFFVTIIAISLILIGLLDLAFLYKEITQERRPTEEEKELEEQEGELKISNNKDNEESALETPQE